MSETSGSENWYEILGVAPGASDAEIGRAFRLLAREFHPDVTPSRSRGSDRRFDEIARAYEVLGDPGRRARYDRTRPHPAPPGSRGTRVPVRNSGVGRTSRPGSDTPRDGRATRSADGERPPADPELPLSFRESLLGTTRRVTIDVEGPCPECRGEGRSPGAPCLECGGTGRVDRSSGPIAIHHVRGFCHGSREQPRWVCTACGGSGRRRHAREITVKVPAGIRDGTRLRIPRPDHGTPMLATVRVASDGRFARKGDDVLVTVPVTLAEAALGVNVTVTGPTNDAVELVVPPGTRSGRRLVVPEADLPSPLRLVAKVEIVVPTELSDGERAALEAFARATRSPRER